MSVFEVVSSGDRRSLVERFSRKSKQQAISELVDIHLMHCTRIERLEADLKAAQFRCDRLEADKKAMEQAHVLYTWLRKKVDQPSNDVVAVQMNIGHDWVPVHDLDRDLRIMIDQEEP